MPLGIDERTPITFYDPENPGPPYPLHWGSSNGQAGNFGILEFDGNNAATTYYDYLEKGFDQELRIGQRLSTVPGVRRGSYEVINTRVEGCSDFRELDCSRIILVPVYKDLGGTGDNRTVEIRGFAYFYLAEHMARNATDIRGYFIKHAQSGTGFVEPGAIDRGAYTIRLIE
ncbi:MAG: hypothetical protein LRY73_02195 [Bacillus sp. (in: Bacteria)]|nr:hypothetical protein [Bacillus sp. (in: firmicutes)]